MATKTVDLNTALYNNNNIRPEEVIEAFSGSTPTEKTALLAGVECWGWYHPYWGVWVPSWSGKVRVRLQNGDVWRLRGLLSKTGPHEFEVEAGEVVMEKLYGVEPNYWQICEEMLQEAARLQDETLFWEASNMQSRLLAGLPPYPEKGEEE